MAARDLTPLFAPSSVAVIGASNDRAKYGNWLSAHALAARNGRRVHLVSRRGEPVLGAPTHRRLVDAGEPVELVVIAVPAASFEAAVDDALAAGARAIVAITAGFAELGAEGAAREAAVVRRVRAAGAVLLGPNCLGVADTGAELHLAANRLPPGRVALLSQSGNIALDVALFLEERGLGVSRFASLGNQADLTAADLLRSCAEHPGTDLIAVYCEDFRDGRAFAAAAADAVEAGKRVVLLTVGASRAAAGSARSHTGALTTDAAVVDAACRAAGIAHVRSPREAADLLAALHAARVPRGRRVAVIADGGGHAALTSDLAAAHGLDVAPFPPALGVELRAGLPPSAATDNPVDLAGAPEHDLGVYARVLGPVLAAPEVDAALVTGWFGGYGEYGPELAAAELAAAEAIAERARAAGKPVLVQTMRPGGAAAQVLRAAGVPVFRASEDAVRTLAALAGLADLDDGTAGAAPVTGAADRARDGEARSTRTSLAGSPPAARHEDRVPALPPPAAPIRAGGYWEARELLRGAGLAFPGARRVAGADEAAAAAVELGGPVALKALGLLHKSDAGGVALGLETEAGVRAAFAAMDARLHAPGYCVERMADTRDAVELIAGVRRDPRFGPVVMVGLGGVLAEVLHDVTFSLAPVDAAGALAMLDRLAGAPLLRGIRGRPPVDRGAVAEAVATLSLLAAAHPEIAELEVNPLLARPGGCEALDARIVLAPDPRS
jgi:acyl-CoA synthetase (NDP forming)